MLVFLGASRASRRLRRRCPHRSCSCTRILKFEGDTPILSKTTNSSRKLKPFPGAKRCLRLKHHNPFCTTTSATRPVRALQNVHISCLSQCPEIKIFWWKYPNKQAPMLNYPPLFIILSWRLTLDSWHILPLPGGPQFLTFRRGTPGYSRSWSWRRGENIHKWRALKNHSAGLNHVDFRKGANKSRLCKTFPLRPKAQGIHAIDTSVDCPNRWCCWYFQSVTQSSSQSWCPF